MHRFLLPPSLPLLLVFSFHIISCRGFLSSCKISPDAALSRAMTSSAMCLSASASSSAENGAVKSKFSDDKKISYRFAKPSDISAIAGLLNSVFEEDGNGEDANDTTTKSNGGDSDDNNNNTFMWDTLTTEKSSEPQLSPTEQLELIETQLAKRMMDAKKEDSLPHSFLVATMPSSVANDDTKNNNNKQEQDDIVIGFLEMGTLPPPISKSPPELPYIGNVAVSNDVRRRRVGSTLVRLATKIAAKWCAPSSETSFPPFLFLSVERNNHNALKFYERLGFEELKVAKESIEKIYLAQGLD